MVAPEDKAWAALRQLLRVDDAALKDMGFDDDEVQKLSSQKFFSYTSLVKAERDDLIRIGLPLGLVSCIMSAQGGVLGSVCMLLAVHEGQMSGHMYCSPPGQRFNASC